MLALLNPALNLDKPHLRTERITEICVATLQQNMPEHANAKNTVMLLFLNPYIDGTQAFSTYQDDRVIADSRAVIGNRKIKTRCRENLMHNIENLVHHGYTEGSGT